MHPASTLALVSLSEGSDIGPERLMLVLAMTLSVGRILLSLLPAGLPGEHRLAGLPITLATSFALGAIALSAQARLWEPEILALGGLALWGPWIALLLFRLASLPAAMVPRHRPAQERLSLANRFVLLVGCSALVLHDSPLPALSLKHLACVILIMHAMRSAHLPAISWCLVPLISTLYLNFVPLGAPSLGFTMGACFSVPWLLVADRRACILACIGFASMWPHSPLLASAGLLTLLALARVPQRRYTLVSSAATSAFFASSLLF